MIKSLLIKNIQSHKHTRLKFHPNVNMIIGKSDKGKSAILNALYWLILNRPTGEVHRSWWGGRMVSKVNIDGTIITLSRQNQNIYTIKQGSNITEFKAFGQNPPPEVTSILNLDTKVNIQRQLERGVPIFLISEPPGDVAKFFNRVAGISIIEQLETAGKKDVKDTTTLFSTKQDELKEERKKVKRLKGVLETDTKLENAFTIQKEIEERKKTIEAIKLLIHKITQAQKRLKQLKRKIALKKKIEKAIQSNQKTHEYGSKIHEIETYKESIQSLQQKLTKINKWIDLQPKVNRAISIAQAIEYNNAAIFSIDEAIERIETTQEKASDLKNSISKLQKDFNGMMPDTCPLCGKEQ